VLALIMTDLEIDANDRPQKADPTLDSSPLLFPAAAIE
jgi:hypothetical protein